MSLGQGDRGQASRNIDVSGEEIGKMIHLSS